jgi:hypothetical protein
VSGLPLIAASICIVAGVLSAPVTTSAADAAAASIREQVRQTGGFERIVVARDNQLQLAGLVGNSELIVEASVTGAKTFLSDDGADIYTDYTFKVQTILKNARRPGLRSGNTVTVRREVGEVLVDGHPAASYENEFPPFESNERYVLFLTAEDAQAVYTVFGGAKGAFTGGDRLLPVRVPVDEATGPAATISRDNFLGDVRALLKFAAQ